MSSDRENLLRLSVKPPRLCGRKLSLLTLGKIMLCFWANLYRFGIERLMFDYIRLWGRFTKEQLTPVWDEAMRSLTLGLYIRDPMTSVA